MNMFAHGVSHLIIILAALAACAACSDNAKMEIGRASCRERV